MTLHEKSDKYSTTLMETKFDSPLKRELGVVWFAQGNWNGMRKGNEGERNEFP